jgi:hypothetical protein
MTSRHFGQGWYAPMEDHSLDMRRYWNERMHPADVPATSPETSEQT